TPPGRLDRRDPAPVPLPCETSSVVLEPVALATDAYVGPREIESVGTHRNLALRTRETAAPEQARELHLEPRLERPLAGRLHRKQTAHAGRSRPAAAAQLVCTAGERARACQSHPARLLERVLQRLVTQQSRAVDDRASRRRTPNPVDRHQV